MVMAESYDFAEAAVFWPGVEGDPGARVFFLVGGSDAELVYLKCEKQQVAALARYLGGMLDDLPVTDAVPENDALDLAEPVAPLYVVGPIGVGFDGSADRFVIGLEEAVPTDDEGDPLDPEAYERRSTTRVLITRAQAAAFIGRAQSLMTAGRPRCRFCGQPIDPDGHPCPRMN
jgi:uncharacterized repeat protein (TIGR03847 family)